MENKVTVVLADANEEFRTMLRQRMEATGEFHVTGNTGDGEQALELVRRLKNHGYCVYYLSNIPQDVLDLLRDRGVLDGFDGGVASCEVHVNKPDPKIYKALLDKYSLKAEECVFIDDRLENVQAAFALGFAGIQMKDSVGTLVRSLATCSVVIH